MKANELFKALSACGPIGSVTIHFGEYEMSEKEDDMEDDDEGELKDALGKKEMRGKKVTDKEDATD